MDKVDKVDEEKRQTIVEYFVKDGKNFRRTSYPRSKKYVNKKGVLSTYYFYQKTTIPVDSPEKKIRNKFKKTRERQYIRKILVKKIRAIDDMETLQKIEKLLLDF